MEISNNSIIKLIVRQGADLDRQRTVLTSGELGYTTDTYRLFVGNGYLSGGNVVGNLFKGSAATITDVSLQPSTVGDTAFATDTNKLYALDSNTGSLSGDWLLIGGIYISNDPHLSISNDNKLSLNPLSSNYISSDAVKSPIIINSGKVSLSPLSANYISSDAVKSPIVIDSGKISLSSTIPFSSVSTKTITVGVGLDVLVDGVNKNNLSFNPLSSNYTIKTSQKYIKVNGLSGGSVDFAGGMSYIKLSAGHYKLVFDDILPVNRYVVNTSILGLEALSYQPRTINTELSACEIVFVNSYGDKTDVNFTTLINYYD